MIEGHGNDTYRYPGIESDFSSNICAAASHRALMAHLASRPQLLARYPEPEAWSLEREIAVSHGIDAASVIVTGGATEAIYLTAQAFPYRPVIPAPTFSEYEDACSCFAHREDKTAMWLCNPNNPTGELYDRHFIERMAREHDMLVIDQSYEHYTDGCVLPPSAAVQTANIVQIHSMTKDYAVPGLRLGYITAHESLTAQLRRYLHPWSVSALAVEGGRYLLKHEELRCHPDLAEAQRLRRQLTALGIGVLPTRTNFMLCHCASITAAELKERLATRHNMLIRDASNFRGLTPHHFRVAAQTPEENDALAEAIRQENGIAK